MSAFPVAEHQPVFAHFGVRPLDEASSYPFSPVFRCQLGERTVAVKRTAEEGVARWVRGLAGDGVRVVTPVELEVANPAELDETRWVVYPWIEGRRYAATEPDLRAAGDLLGRIHAAAVPDTGVEEFSWPVPDFGEVLADLDELREAFERHAPDDADRVMARLDPLGRGFATELLPPIRDASLPVTECSVDYKANNLVYVNDVPVLVDPDNAERAPRLLDLALAVLLFHNEEPAAPPRLFTGDEWGAFLAGYATHVTLTPAEREVWPTALRYMLWEWGTWSLTNAEDWQWEDPDQRAFLVDLALVDEAAYPLD